jgi:hypothetical protein
VEASWVQLHLRAAGIACVRPGPAPELAKEARRLSSSAAGSGPPHVPLTMGPPHRVGGTGKLRAFWMTTVTSKVYGSAEPLALSSLPPSCPSISWSRGAALTTDDSALMARARSVSSALSRRTRRARTAAPTVAA